MLFPAKYYRNIANSKAVTALILAIGSFIFGPFLAIPALVLAFLAFREIRKKHERGIVLIVLSVILALVGGIFWSSVFLAPSGKLKAFDSTRKSDLGGIVRQALDLYYDVNQQYPPTLVFGRADRSDDNNGNGSFGLLFSTQGNLALQNNIIGPSSDGKDYDFYYYIEDRSSENDVPKHFALYSRFQSDHARYYYAINDEGNRWMEVDKKTNPPTCVKDRKPVCGY
jgi:hypothetical protein